MQKFKTILLSKEKTELVNKIRYMAVFFQNIYIFMGKIVLVSII